MVADLFERIKAKPGPLGQYASVGDGYFMFPELEGEIASKMKFQGEEVLVWSLNNYLGLANHPEVREIDARAASDWGMAYPMGARIMSGQSKYHKQLETELANFSGKKYGCLVNYGFPGIMSALDALIDRHDVVVYDSDSHGSIIDGLRMSQAKRYAFHHNDIADCEKNLQRATKLAEKQGGGILVVTEGVFGMRGMQGKVAEIAKLKDRYKFRLIIDDAHGFGTQGKTGAGTHEEQNCIDEVDIYFATFAKSMASIGGFLASNDKDIIRHLRFNMRSQIFAKTMPMPIVIGALKRLDLIRRHPEYREALWRNVRHLQNGLRDQGFDIGDLTSCVTPVYMKGTPAQTSHVVKDLRENYKIFCSIVMYPIIPKGYILLRLIPTSYHTPEEIDYTINAFKEIRHKLDNHLYDEDVVAEVKIDRDAL